MDSVYKTPVFKLFSGQSSCPWEAGTAHREWPNLQLAPGTGYIAENILANEVAVFELELGNISATNEDMTYNLSSIPGSNPHGAIIRVNGTILNGNGIQYFCLMENPRPLQPLSVDRWNMITTACKLRCTPSANTRQTCRSEQRPIQFISRGCSWGTFYPPLQWGGYQCAGAGLGCLP